MKKILVFGGGGFIGGHMAKVLKEKGNFVRIVDLKEHEYFVKKNICDEFIIGDLRDPMVLSETISYKNKKEPFDELYQFAADMGGAAYIFTGKNDANLMHNSSLINLNTAHYSKIFNVKKIFYSSSACLYPEYNQADSKKPNCKEDSAYPANPDNEYGWEKLFSERLYLAFHRNHGLNIRIARFHNIFGPQSTWVGGKEKAPTAICRKILETENNGEIEIWGDGEQTRSFLYIDDCINAVLKLMNSNFIGPVNIGSENMVTINNLAQEIINISNKNIKIKNIWGEEFEKKYGFKCPIGVKGRNSDNTLFREKVDSFIEKPLIDGLKKTYAWVNEIKNKK